jgi:surface antigen
LFWDGKSNETITKALALYPLGDEFPTQWDRAWNLAGQVVFTCMYALVPPTSIDTLTDDPFSRDAFLSNQMATVKNVSSVFSYAYVLVSLVADSSLTVNISPDGMRQIPSCSTRALGTEQRIPPIFIS